MVAIGLPSAANCKPLMLSVRIRTAQPEGGSCSARDSPRKVPLLDCERGLFSVVSAPQTIHTLFSQCPWCSPTAFRQECAYGLVSLSRYRNRYQFCLRSEEHRVGKECRSRWWPYD